MAYTLNIGKNLSEPNTVLKDISIKTTLTNVLIKENTSEVDPVFIVQTDIDLSDCDYLYGDAFNNRRYFIKDITTIAHQRYEIACHVDVITTYYQQYKNCKCIANRSQNNFNLYLYDNQVEILSLKEIGTLDGQKVGGDTTQYILITTGGATS